jgi:cytochrome b6-f complex iron-sulfur subunit
MSESKTNQPVGRRKFLSISLASVFSGLVAAATYPLYKYLVPPSLNMNQNRWVKIPINEIRQKGSISILVQRKPVIIIATKDDSRDSRDFRVFSALCSHLGCSVMWQGEKEAFICPCHSASFDKEGEVLSGPPPKPLQKIPFTVEKNNLIVGVPA